MTPEDAVQAAIAAANQAVASAQAAARTDTALGEAAAAQGDAQAQEAYLLTKSILEDDAVELIPALLALEATAIMEGLAAYVAEQTAAAAALVAVQTQAGVALSNVSEAYREALNRVAALADGFVQNA
jgi:hypothetical protein